MFAERLIKKIKGVYSIYTKNMFASAQGQARQGE